MDKRKILDEIDEKDSRRYSILSFRNFLLTLLLLVLFVLLSIIKPKSSFFDSLLMILIIGFLISSISGIVLAIKSLSKRESDSIYKIVGAIGNIFLFLITLAMIAFVVQDLIAWFE